MKVFSGSANVPLAEKIAKALGEKISPRELFVFPDGERRVQIQEPVVDANCVVVQSTSTPVDQNYMELFFLCDGVRRSGARTVTAVIPYFGYQRQDHVFRDGEAVSLEVVTRILATIEVDYIIAFDLHSIKIPELFSMRVSHLSALPLFAKMVKKNHWDTDDTVLVSPDMGGIRRIKILSDLLDELPYATIEKNRDLETGDVQAVGYEGPLGKRAVIVDDMISSGGTLIKAAELLIKKGFKEVVACATHPVFSQDAQDLIEKSVISECIVTDTVFVPKEKYFSKLKILSIAEMVAEEVRRIHER